MTVFANDPVRVNITWDILKKRIYQAPKGIDVTFKKDENYEEGDVWFLQFVASDTMPYNPDEEKYKEDIEAELNKLHILQDHIREFYPYRQFPKKKRVVEAVLNEKVFEKENRYDVLLDKIKNKHYLPNSKIQFGTIEDS